MTEQLFSTSKYTASTAEFSPCGLYRYQLRRSWEVGHGYAMFIGLNPSTADASEDDPTIRRCIGFAKTMGCHGMFMTNIFAYRSTDPYRLASVSDPVGSINDAWLHATAQLSRLIIACWGVHGHLNGRGEQVKKLLHGMKCFGVTKCGFPKHPLYLAKETALVNFN